MTMQLNTNLIIQFMMVNYCISNLVLTHYVFIIGASSNGRKDAAEILNYKDEAPINYDHINHSVKVSGDLTVKNITIYLKVFSLNQFCVVHSLLDTRAWT